jgi:hypothetical protein
MAGILIWSIPIAGAIGSYLLPIEFFGLNLFFFRQETILLLCFGLATQKSWPWTSIPVARWYMLVAALWVTYGTASLLWAPSWQLGTVELLAIAFGFSIGVVLLNLRAYDPVRMDWLRGGWICAYLITGCIAVWEILTGNHLPSAFDEALPYYLRNIEYAQSTFANPNNYASFVVLCTPFIIWSFLVSRKKIVKLVYFSLLGLSIVLISYTGCRSALFALLGQLFVWSLMPMSQSPGRSLGRICCFVIVLLMFAFLILGKLSDTMIPQKMNNLLETILEGDVDVSPLRTALILNGLYLILESFGMGIGAGGFRYRIQDYTAPYATRADSFSGEHLVDPHNFMIEITSQYGLLILAVFFLFLIYQFRIFWKSKKEDQASGDRRLYALSLTGILGLVGLAGIHSTCSSFINLQYCWLILASITVIASSIYSPVVIEKVTRRIPSSELITLRRHWNNS